MAVTNFSTFLKEEVSKVKGIAYPIKAGFLRRVFIRKAPCSKLHPNPNDEFCFPDIGPNEGIMARYMQKYRDLMAGGHDRLFEDSSVREPLIVERIHPDGYMILNGHHRWGAACRTGMKKLRIKIVDLTQKDDLQKMLASSASSRRVTFDLDEVIFRPEDDPWLEEPLRFPLNRWFRERLRRGVPALFHMLNSEGYDIWIYSSGLFSTEYLRYYFKHYHVRVAGIVTGMARKAPAGTDTKKALEALMNSKYTTTVNNDNQEVLRTDAESASFDEYRLSGNGETWSREVMDIFDKMKKKG